MKKILLLIVAITLKVTVFLGQDEGILVSDAEKSDIRIFIGVSNDFFSVRSYNNFGFWSGRRTSSIPYQRGSRNNSTFSILPFAGIKISETVDLGLAFNHLGESSRTRIKEGEIDPVEVDFLSRSNLNGIGLFSRITVHKERRWGMYLRPALMYYTDDYKEYRDSRLDLQIEDRFIFFNLGVGAYYAFNDNLRGLARFTGLSYVNGRWKEVGSNIGESYSEAGRNYSRSGIYLGVEWIF